jgi:uncharacterized protein YndB with AHSA1/START domain
VARGIQEVTLAIVTSITIPAEREAVWRTFIAVERWPKWSPWGLRFLHQPRFEVGARFFVTVPAPLLSGITLRFPCQVTTLENPRTICWTGKVLGVSGFHRFTLEETPDGCRVLSEEEFRRPFDLLLWPLKSTFERRVVEFLFCLRSAACATEM